MILSKKKVSKKALSENHYVFNDIGVKMTYRKKIIYEVYAGCPKIVAPTLFLYNTVEI